MNPLQPIERTDPGTSIFDELKPIPSYYSQNAVYGFSVVSGVLFGAILLAINIKNTEGKKGIVPVLAFGTLFTIAQILIVTNLRVNIGMLPLILNISGGMALKQFFWSKYIGKHTPYSNQPIWIPLAFTILLLAIIFLSLFYAPGRS
ncbi:MAG: hypothetical protein V4649_15205 [Bacteroidota bacterium]